MAELYGWAGKILRVNLSTGIISNVDTTKYVPKYIGGRGIADRIAWEEVPFENEVEPFDEENKLIFMVGPLVGTLAPTNGKTIAVTIAPRIYPKPLFTRSLMGGFFGPELRYTGYDGVIVEGKAKKPVYLAITNDVVELKDADGLWGNGTYATQALLKGIHSRDAQVMCIGPAGENLIRFATIQHNASSAMGQVGFGAVMGSKKLKAIVARGSGYVKIPDPEKFMTLYNEVRTQTAPGWVTVFDGNPIQGDKGYSSGPPCTFACTAPCGPTLYKDLGRKLSPGIVTATPLCNEENWYGKPEQGNEVFYEGDDMEIYRYPGFDDATASELRERCADLGMCTWNFQTFGPYIIRCVKDGITELQGYHLDPLNGKWWYDFFTDIAFRKGIGDVFAEGLRRAADILGVEKDTAEFMEFAWGCPAHRDSRQNDSHPDPGYIVTALQWAMDSRDPYNSHHSYTLLQQGKEGFINKYNDGKEPRLKDVALKLYGNDKAFDRGVYEGKAEPAIFSSKRSCIKDSLFLCDWVFPRLLKVFSTKEEFEAAADITGDTAMEVKLFNAVTGLNWSEAELDKAGERINTLEQAIQVMQGRTRAMSEVVISHFEYPDRVDGTRLDASKFRMLIDKFHEAFGWDKATGCPTRAKLEELGLEDVADKLDTLGKLPQGQIQRPST